MLWLWERIRFGRKEADFRDFVRSTAKRNGITVSQQFQRWNEDYEQAINAR